MKYERRIALGILAETMKEFKGFTIKSTIRNSAHSNSEEQVDAINDSEEQVDDIHDSEEQVDDMNNSEELIDAISDRKSDPSNNPRVATYTTNGNFPQKLLKIWFVSKIIQGAIGPINQLVLEDVPVIRET